MVTVVFNTEEMRSEGWGGERSAPQWVIPALKPPFCNPPVEGEDAVNENSLLSNPGFSLHIFSFEMRQLSPFLQMNALKSRELARLRCGHTVGERMAELPSQPLPLGSKVLSP